MPESGDKLLAWMDFETDGLYENGHDPKILEIAIVLTDFRLQVLGEFSTPVLERGDHVDFLRLACATRVREMHDENGLWAEIESFGMPLRNAERNVIDVIRTAVKEYGYVDPTIFMAGSGVSHFDRRLVQEKLPELNDYLHYRPRDASQLEWWVKDFLPERAASLDKDPGVHRAMPDVKFAIRKTFKLISALS